MVIVDDLLVESVELGGNRGVPKPETVYVACFGEATFEEGPIQYNLSTMLRQE